MVFEHFCYYGRCLRKLLQNSCQFGYLHFECHAVWTKSRKNMRSLIIPCILCLLPPNYSKVAFLFVQFLSFANDTPIHCNSRSIPLYCRPDENYYGLANGSLPFCSLLHHNFLCVFGFRNWQALIHCQCWNSSQFSAICTFQLSNYFIKITMLTAFQMRWPGTAWLQLLAKLCSF